MQMICDGCAGSQNSYFVKRNIILKLEIWNINILSYIYNLGLLCCSVLKYNKTKQENNPSFFGGLLILL